MPRSQTIPLLIFVTLLSLFNIVEAIEAVIDFFNEEESFHEILGDLIIATISIAAISYILWIILWQRFRLASLEKSFNTVNKRLKSSNAQLRKVQVEFCKLIDNEFVSWGLTQSEKEIAYLMLKGLNFKEIGEIRGTLEKTVRQQASKIYDKSGVGNRHELSAYFFEDLLQSEELFCEQNSYDQA